MPNFIPDKKKAVKFNLNNNSRGHIVTVLLQDYFHRGVFKQVIGEKQWSRFEGRLDKNVDDTLSLLGSFNIKATFFTLGWIAEQYPEIIEKIVSEGHEIASAGHWARSIREMTPVQFREDLHRSRRALERAGANRIVGYRCAYQWFRKQDFWAFDILAEEGYLYDASYRPVLFQVGGSSMHKYSFEYETKSGKIREFPTSTQSILGFNLPIAGGNYLRQFPDSYMIKCFKKWCDKTAFPFVLYFHPWELDAQQPEITAVGKISKIKQYRNLGKMQLILPKYFKKTQFQSISQYMGIPLEYPDKSVSQTRDSQSLKPEVLGLKPDERNLTPVTIVIPCYNESTSLRYLAKALNELNFEGRKNYSFKFVFVDDKSTDNTVAKLEEVFGSDQQYKIVRHQKNIGVAGALETGVKVADTEIVCTIDADCSYDPLELLKMIPLLKDKVDMVTSSPYHRDGFVLGVPKWRLFLSKTLSSMYHLFLNHKLATYTSCFRVCRRSSVLKLNIAHGDFRGIVELLARLDIQGGHIEEYATTLQSRIFGYSKMKIINTIFGHLRLLKQLFEHSSHYRRKKCIVKNTYSASTKKVWIDLDNSPHVPFFRPIIRELDKRGTHVIVTARDCFQVCGLAELFNMQYNKIGRHYGKNKILKVVGTIIRSLQLLPTALKEKPALSVSHGSRSQLITAKLMGIPAVIILDYEYTQGLGFIAPDWIIGPEVIPESVINSNKSRILRYPGLKEDVYAPSFKPDPKVLTKLGLSREDFIVTIRPPATEAHYHNPESDKLFIAVVEFLAQKPDVRIVILPRNEIKQTKWIKKMWAELCETGKIIIPEHVVNGLDLIWYSDFVVSGGGTMNREAAALGVPVYSIFRGKIGGVDQYLSDTGRLILLKNAEDAHTKIDLVRWHRPAKPENKSHLALRRIVDNIEEILNS